MIFRRLPRPASVVASMLLGSLYVVAATAQQANPAGRVVSFNIARQPIGDALTTFGKQSGLTIILGSTVDARTITPAVVGNYTPDEALTKLLAVTGLRPKYLDARTVAVGRSRVDEDPSPPGKGSAKSPGDGQKVQRSFSDPFRMAQTGGGAPASASAVDSSLPSKSEELEEIVVTAQKYAQRTIDVPISMTVIEGPELQRLQITNLEDLQLYVPGLFVDNNGGALYISLQGISNIYGQGAQVGTYLDEADVTSEASIGLDPNTYDLERLEVLKGPQGTLYGDGSIGGTIRYITNKPVLSQFQANAYVTGTFSQYGAPESRVDAAINMPLVENVLGLRIATDLDQGGGWIDQPAANLKNVNSKNRVDVRIEGRWQPATSFTVDATQVIHRQTTGPVTGEDPPGQYTQVFGLTTTPSVETNFNITNLTLHWDPGSISLVNSATYFTNFISSTNFGLSFQLTPPPSQELQEYYTWQPTFDESWSDEFRISNSGAANWHWMVGTFFKHIDDESPPYPSYYYFGLPVTPGVLPQPPILNYYDVNSGSGSVFADTNYEFFDKLLLGAGVRYFKDEENGLLVVDSTRESATFTSTDPRFYARYQISTSVNIYANAAKGFRSGGFNGLGTPPYGPEHVWTYSIGTKMRLLDGHMSLDTSYFLSNYNGYLVVGVVPYQNQLIDITSNEGDARIKGVEAEMLWSPADGWRLGINGDYIDARFIDINAANAAHQVGDPLDYVPRYQVTASAERDFWWLARSAFARVDYTERAPAVYRNRSLGPWYFSQSDYLYLLSFRMGMDWTENFSLSVFAENLLNDRGYATPDVIETFAVRQQPRTFGFNFNVKFQ